MYLYIFLYFLGSIDVSKIIHGFKSSVKFLYLMAYPILGLFNAKAILSKRKNWYYLTHRWGDKGVHAFPEIIRHTNNE